MAHSTTPLGDSALDIDIRLANLKKNHLPGKPFRLTAQDDPINVRKNGVCKQCGHFGDDPCYCHAHHTFISRGDEMPTFSDDPKPSRKTVAMVPPDTISNGKKISLDAYKSRLKNAASNKSNSKPSENSEVSTLHAGIVSPGSNKRHMEAVSSSAGNSSRGDLSSKYAEPSDRPAKKLKSSPNPMASSQQKKAPQRSPAHRSTSTPSNQLLRPRSPKKTSSTTRRERSPAAVRDAYSRDSPPLHPQRQPGDQPKSPRISQRPGLNRRSPGAKSPFKHRSPIVTNSSSVKTIPKTNSSKTRPKELEKAADEEDDFSFELPAFMSPLPDEINRAVDEYERQHSNTIGKDWDMSESTSRSKAGRASLASKGMPQATHSKMTAKPNSMLEVQGVFVDYDQREESSSAEKSTVSQKFSSKRPPTVKKVSSKSKSSSDREFTDDASSNQLLVTLRYGIRYSKKVLRILRTEVEDIGGKDRLTTQARASEDSIHSEKLKPSKPDYDQSPGVSSQSFRSPAIKVGALKGDTSTPNRKASAKMRNNEGTTPSSRGEQDPPPPGGFDADAVKFDSETFLSLGIKLKHATDKALGMKDSDEFNLLKGAVYASHCVISYLLAFGLEDELRRREKRSSSSEGWKAVANYIEVLLNSRLKANPHIHGLLYQLGAVVTERVLLLDQQRLMGLPLSENSASPGSNHSQTLDMFRKVRSDVVRTMRTNREWWFLGHQRLGYSTIQESYRSAWNKRSLSVIRRVDINVGAYLVPYYLPLFSGSTPLEAASFAWRVTQEWSNINHVELNTGLTMKGD